VRQHHTKDILATFLLFLLALPCNGQGQSQSLKVPKLEMHRLWLQKSTDGLSHSIESIAIGQSGDSQVLYVVESTQKPVQKEVLRKGALGKVFGNFILWTLDETGSVLHKEVIAKMSSRESPHVTMLPQHRKQLARNFRCRCSKN